MHRFSSIALIDDRGWILLQERDEHPVIDPEKWGFPGGGIEEGEEPEAAAYRELAEETGITVTGGLELFDCFSVFHEHTATYDDMYLFALRADLTDADIVVGEGRQMVFVAPEVALGLDLTAGAALALPVFLGSQMYGRMTT
jgi:8-oxo-dGTP diphosphatase